MPKDIKYGAVWKVTRYTNSNGNEIESKIRTQDRHYEQIAGNPQNESEKEKGSWSEMKPFQVSGLLNKKQCYRYSVGGEKVQPT